MNSKLEVGMLALIINTKQAANRSLIGRVVTVEFITKVGDDISHFHQGGEGKPLLEHVSGMIYISGADAPSPSRTSDGKRVIIRNHGRFDAHNLMPLPPLEEEELTKEQELEYS